MQRDPGIALEISGLQRIWHRSDTQLTVLELDLRAADPRRTVAAQGRHGAVFADAERGADRRHELGFGLLDLPPTRHGDQSAKGGKERLPRLALRERARAW